MPGTLQVLLNGIVNGGTLALIAMAFSFAYLPTGVFHLALGGIYALAPYLLAMLVDHGWNVHLATLTMILCCGGLSAACELFNHRPLVKNGASSNVHLVSSLGLYIVI